MYYSLWKIRKNILNSIDTNYSTCYINQVASGGGDKIVLWKLNKQASTINIYHGFYYIEDHEPTF